MTRDRDPADDPAPDVEIGAVAKAKRVRFRSTPETEVTTRGEGGTESVRENLPDEVEPGVTYRDVRVAWRAKASASEEWRRRSARRVERSD